MQVAPYLGHGFDRVWLPDLVNIRPGIAVTRSFGDLCAESVGVCPEPEIKSVSLVELNAEIIVIMSDGVFEHAPNIEVLNIVSHFQSPADACHKMVTVSAQRWVDTCGGSCDDITDW